MNKSVTLNQILREKGFIPSLLTFCLSAFYIIYFISPSLQELKWVIIIELLIMLITFFIIIPIENFMLTKSLSTSIEDWINEEETSMEQRTKLFLSIAQFPLQKGIITFFTFLFSSSISIVCFLAIPFIHITARVAGIAYISCIFSSYIGFLIATNYTENICNTYCEELVIQGLDKELIEEKKHFGLRITHRCFLYLIIPVFFAFIILYFNLQLKNGSSQEINLTVKMQILRIITIVAINIIIYVILTTMFYKKIKNTTDTLSDAIEEVLEEGNHKLYIRTSIFDSMQYSIYVLNEIIENYAKLITKSKTIGNEVLETTGNLSNISKELETTSTEQNSDVQEISATMGDTNASLKNIDLKLSNISSAIDSANKEVSVGFDIMRQNINQMDLIESSNNSILNGIKNLADHISMIENVINIINDIAEQTRIIAFNAELEAVGAGTKGKNFHIIASEIRRLANSIVDSIMDIKTHTDNIQKATQTLTEIANNETNFIQEERNIAQKLESHFHNIQFSTDETANKTSDISSTVSQQAAAFNQIVITLNQISSSIRSFTVSTKNISQTATKIQEAAERLNTLH
ncbi:MAG: methyl-accepting chemotaxis protein [Treponema sp.]|nr:methyl-accepting chemotaxis protein [Treponema sp.]